MEKYKYLLLNLSNQGNLNNCSRTNLFQYNFVSILGLGYLNRSRPDNLIRRSKLKDRIPISVTIDKTGEIEISGLDEDISNENIRVYTDKKVTQS